MNEDDELIDELRGIAATTPFSGVLSVDRPGHEPLTEAFGLADRAHGIANTVDTRIGTASAAKGFTALAVMRLVELGTLSLDTTARSLLGGDLPLVDDGVTIGHLLSHRSGIGDYLDEDAMESITDYVMTRPVHELATAEAYLPMLDGHAQVGAPGAAFTYNNGGFVLLAILAERASGTPYHDLVDEHVVGPAGLTSTAFLRSDELPGDAAIGYLHLDGLRTNLLHLPVRGVGDGGIATTAADVRRFWAALFAGEIVRPDTVELMTRTHGSDPDGWLDYGLGFWLGRDNGAVLLEGYDAGASFRSAHRPSDGTGFTVMSNTSEGAWPLARRLVQMFD